MPMEPLSITKNLNVLMMGQRDRFSFKLRQYVSKREILNKIFN
jgi:hypothetical protein